MNMLVADSLIPVLCFQISNKTSQVCVFTSSFQLSTLQSLFGAFPSVITVIITVNLYSAFFCKRTSNALRVLA